MTRSLPLLIAAALLASCGGDPTPAQPQATAPAQTNPAETNTATATPVPDVTEPPTLEPLQATDAASLPGELACSFTGGSRQPLMLARADVGGAVRGAAVIRLGDTVHTLGAPVGGFAALEKGGDFSGDGITLRVTPGERAPNTGEEVIRSAKLTLTGADFQLDTDGSWRCGP